MTTYVFCLKKEHGDNHYFDNKWMNIILSNPFNVEIAAKYLLIHKINELIRNL